MAEFLSWKKAQKDTQDVEEALAVKGDDDDGEETESMSDVEEDKEYVVDGVEYIKHWDSDGKNWIILEPEEYAKVGIPKDDGGIDFEGEDEEKAHATRVSGE